MKIFIGLITLLLFSGCVLEKKSQEKDPSSPQISISAPTTFNSSTNSTEFTINYKYADTISLTSSNVIMTKTGSINGSLSVIGTGFTSRKVLISGISGKGTIGISVSAGTASNTKSKKINLASASHQSPLFEKDLMTPALTISSPSVTMTSSGPITYTATYANASAVTLSSADVSLITTGTVAGAISVSGSGNLIRTITVQSISGNGTFKIAIASRSAISESGNYTVASEASGTVNVDNIQPSISISAPSSTTTKLGPIIYTVNYSSDTYSNTLSSTDILLNKTGTADGVVSVSGTGATTRTVTISSITGNGDLGISIAANTAIDQVGNLALASSASSLFNADNIAPGITLSPPSSALSNGSSVSYFVNYGGANSISLNSTHVTINKTGTADAVATVSGTSPSFRTVTLSGITGDGTLSISIAANTASDTAGNFVIGSGASSTFTVDTTVPTLSISAPNSLLTNSGPVEYTLTYSGASAISLTSANVTLNKTGTANGLVSVSGAGATTRTISISSVTGNGSLGISVSANTSSDNAGNTNIASAASTIFTVDNIAPTLSVSAPSTSLSKSGPVDYTVTYANAAAVTLIPANITLTKTGSANGSVTVSGSGSTTRTISVESLTGTGTIAITIAAATASDAASNLAIASGLSTAFTVDNTAPTLSISAPSLPALSSGSIFYTVSYSGSNSISLAPADVSLNKQGTADGVVAVTGSGTTRTVTISSVTGNGRIGINIAAATASDSAGNNSASAGPSSYFIASTDPLFLHSWHLYNYAQKSFSSSSGVSTNDLNLMTTWNSGYLGQAVNVLVSDTGVQSAHPDLAANFLGGAVSKDFTNGISPDYLFATAEPILNTVSTESHGTAVAGIIAAVAKNSIGGSGVAPSAKIASANFLNSAFDMNSFLAQVSGDFKIVNQSWGSSQCNISTPIPAYELKLKTDRKVYVKSSGNDFSVNSSTCGGSNINRHGNSNFDSFNTNPYTIVVAALNASGVKSSYSSPGSNVWITGFGGEYGTSSPAIVTTDLSGCTYGMSPLDAVNTFQVSSHPLNTLCNYTSIMNGTSSAAPTISGVAALLFSANTNLTARDVKYILASTATKVNPTAGNTNNLHVVSPTGHVWQQGWITNAAGFNFHNYYGFGLVNTDAAVAMATASYTNMAAEVELGYTASGAIGLSIPDNSAVGVENTIVIPTNITIESVQILSSITHADIGDLGIELTSPNGTKSILLNVNSGIEGLADLQDEVFLSNAFYGESSAGNWKIKLLDGKSGITGTLNDWGINIIGH